MPHTSSALQGAARLASSVDVVLGGAAMRREFLLPRAARTCAAAPQHRPGAAGAAWSAGHAAGPRPPAGSCAWPSSSRRPPARRRAGLGARGTRPSCLLSACANARPKCPRTALVARGSGRGGRRACSTPRSWRDRRAPRRASTWRYALRAACATSVAFMCSAPRASSCTYLRRAPRAEPQRVGRGAGAACVRAGRRCVALRGLGGALPSLAACCAVARLGDGGAARA
jgi:hypothetical protein